MSDLVVVEQVGATVVVQEVSSAQIVEVVAAGPQGASGTIAIGSVTTGAAGSSASVTNVGTPVVAVLNFTIPRGEKGDTGDVTPDATAAKNAAQTAATAAAASQSAAATSATSAASSATAAASSASTATTQAGTATTAATTAVNSANSAAASATTATTKASEASTSATNASNSAGNALGYASQAQDWATKTTGEVVSGQGYGAKKYANDAATSASSAGTSASNASSSAASASASATNAATSATNAYSSETSAAGSANAASSYAGTAATQAANASSSASTATTKAFEASTSATNAATSATNAASSATSAASSATSASTSATTATTQAGIATTKASDASTSASSASTSATSAASSATAAATAKAGAESARDSALAAYANFNDQYLGPKSSDPTTDNTGGPLAAGNLYYNTNSLASGGGMKIYDGSNWLAAYASLSGALLTANNLSDLASASSARTNLGLGNVENKSSATIRGELTSSNVTTALGYTPISDTLSGNLTFSGSNQRIIGDFTSTSRVLVQTNVANSNTVFGLIPNGTAVNSQFHVWGAADITNAPIGAFTINSAQVQIQSTAAGTGTILPFRLLIGSSEVFRATTGLNFLIGTSTDNGTDKLQVSGSISATSLSLTANQTANYVYAAPNGSAGAPMFRALVAADIPTLSYAPTAGSSSINTLGTVTTGTWSAKFAPRVVSIATGTTITMNADTTDVATQTNTQAAGTLTIAAPTGTPVDGQKLMLRLQATNAQTFSFNAIFTGGTDLALPTTSSSGSKYDYLGFVYNSTASKWQLIAKAFGY